MHYVISDLHIGHKKIIEFSREYRPFETIEEHDEAIVNRWNSVVTDEDTTYILGDVFFRKESAQYVRRLKGKKILIGGNHDTYSTPYELAELYDKVYGAFQYGKEVIMTHIPVHPSQLMHRFKLNLHGHLHSHLVLNHPLEPTGVDNRYVNCSAEHFNLTPQPLKQLIEQRLKELSWKV